MSHRTTDRAIRWLLAALLPAAALACGGEGITPADAAGVIQRHLYLVAPNGPGGHGWEGARFEVVELSASPAGYTAHFRAFDDPRDKGRLFQVTLAPAAEDEDGWRVARYGPTLRDRVALLVAAERRAGYAPLLTALTALQDSAARVYRQWSRPLKFASRDVPDTATAAGMLDELRRGIPAAVLREGLSRREPDLPRTVRWGVTEEVPGDGAEVVWVRDTDQGNTVCGQLIGSTPPAAWSWLEERFPTCRGGAGRYVQQTPARWIFAEIDRSGGALGVSGTPGSSQ